MAIVLVCDGCSEPGTPDTLTTVGRVDPVAFCAACLKTWRATEAELEARLVAFRREFEAGLAALRQTSGLQGVPGG